MIFIHLNPPSQMAKLNPVSPLKLIVLLSQGATNSDYSGLNLCQHNCSAKNCFFFPLKLITCLLLSPSADQESCFVHQTTNQVFHPHNELGYLYLHNGVEYLLSCDHVCLFQASREVSSDSDEDGDAPEKRITKVELLETALVPLLHPLSPPHSLTPSPPHPVSGGAKDRGRVANV